ncbi:MAG TPA: hypothetical protein VJV74_13265, partial [Terriglobia bacterium]|nr:hypothetical protein [Terriglobia bacterium]
MRLRNAFLLAAIMTAVTLPLTIRASQDEPAPPQARKDTPYHQAPTKGEESASVKPRQHLAPVTDHVSYPKMALTKIEILPAAISILGP